MITISQCSDSVDWSINDRLSFQIFNGTETTYFKTDDKRTRILGNTDFNKFDNNVFTFYYKEPK